MAYYHSCDVEDLKRIKASGHLRAPVFVYSGSATSYNPARDCVLTLNLRGFQLRKDPHPYATEGYFVIDRNIPASRIVNVKYYWGTEND